MAHPSETDAELAMRYRKGDLNAGYLMLTKHYKYILKRILEITNGHWFSEDILQAGAVGLFEAMKRFDPDRGYKFLTYADSWIRKYIYIEVRNELLPMGGMYVGRDLKEKLFNFIKLTLQGKSDKEIMEALHINKKKLEELKIMNVTAARVRSLDYVPDNDSTDDNTPDQYNFVDINQLTPLEEAEANELKEFVSECIENFSKENPISAKILSMRLGINCEHEYTKAEICKKLNLKKFDYNKYEREGNKYLRQQLINNGFYDT